MAEVLFTFLVTVALLLILWAPRPSWSVALVAGLLVGYAVDVRSEGLPVLVLFPVAVACVAGGTGAATWRRP